MSSDQMGTLARVVALVSIGSVFIFSVGCQTAGPGRSAPTQSDRLMNAYPELRGGRFALIADFEDAKQMGVVEIVSISDSATGALSPHSGQKATGPGGLLFTAASRGDTVVLANKGGQDWYLKRDWRAYDLLMMSVASPEESLSLDVSISGGPKAQRSTIFTTVPLDRGWNVLRLDLGEVGERVPLDDVREIRLNIAGLSRAATLTLDDVVLTGHRRAVSGDPTNTIGELYVQEVGRRLRIGAGGKFELTVGNGQIRGWHNLADDPNRLRNLLYESTLGPNPVEVGGEENGAALPGLGATVVASHRIVEANAVRAILECEWRFVDDPARARAGLDAAPFHRWRYTVYPTGQLYVLVEATSETGDGWSPELGVSVGLASPSAGGIETFIPQVESDESNRDFPMFASLSNRNASAGLLLVPTGTSRPFRLAERVSTDRRTVAVTAMDNRNDRPVKSWISHIYLSRRGEDSTAELTSRAVDAYGLRSPVRIERGSPVAPRAGSIRLDGFYSVEGCYAIAPDAGRLRVVIDGGERPVFSPAFCIPAEVGHQAWVYVDHLSFEPVETNDVGQLLFQLPGIVGRRTEVEVLFRRPGAKSSP